MSIPSILITGALTLFFFTCSFSGCANVLQSKVSGNLNAIAPNMTIAILPVETTDENQRDAALLFRQSLYANLEQSQFRVMERYLVDALLEQNNIATPEKFKTVSPLLLGELLGTDAVLMITMKTMNRIYAIVHSSIELGISLKMVDTRTGEILWLAEQNETEYDGIAKIPTGITGAAFAPVQLVTNKINLHRLTQKMTDKLTALVKKPFSAKPNEKFESPMIASTAANEIKTLNPVLPKAPSRQATLNKTRKNKNLKKLQGPFTIQVGAYRKKHYADKMIAALKAKGYNAFLYPSPINGQTIYKVQIEKFQSRKKAIQYGIQFSIQEKIYHFITRFQPG